LATADGSQNPPRTLTVNLYEKDANMSISLSVRLRFSMSFGVIAALFVLVAGLGLG